MAVENLGFAFWYVNRRRGWDDEREDLIGDASLALVRAARVFDPAKGKFSAIASRCMRNELSNSLYFRRKWDQLESLDTIDPETSLPRIETVPDEDQDAARLAEDADRRQMVIDALTVLPERERAAIILHYGLRKDDPLPFEEVGRQLKPTMTGAGVRGLIKRGLAKMRKTITQRNGMLPSHRPGARACWFA